MKDLGTREAFELEAINAFEQEREERRRCWISDGDGKKGVIYLADKVFRGNVDEFRRWLREGSLQGTPRPIDLLLNEAESGRKWDDYWVIREALLKMLLERHGLTVERPKGEVEYVRIALKGRSGETFFSFRPASELTQAPS